MLTRFEIRNAILQIIIVLITSYITAREPEGWLSVIAYYGSVLFVPMLSTKYYVNLAVSMIHTFFLLSFYHLLETVKGSVGGPLTDFFTPVLTISLYSFLHFVYAAMRRQRRV